MAILLNARFVLLNVALIASLSVHVQGAFPTRALVLSSSSTIVRSNTFTTDKPISGATLPVASDVPIPGVYPSVSPDSPPAPGSALVPDFGPAWDAAHAKAKTLIESWSTEDKVKALTGVGGQSRCIGNIAPVGDWPGLCLDDSPTGVRSVDFVTEIGRAHV